MPIYAPGHRDRHNRRRSGKSRNVVAMLSLTAMVDMFTVLVIFLLQNYNTSGELIEVDDAVELPKATAVKEIKPAQVVVVSKEGIMLGRELVANFNDVREQGDWMINGLHNRMVEAFKLAAQKRAATGSLGAIRQAVDATKPNAPKPEDDRKVTVQADKAVDFLTIKKVMWTLTEAGASEINFAVIKNENRAQVVE